MRYALLIYSPAEGREYSQRIAEGATNPHITAYTRALKDAGVLVGAEQLTHTDTATSVRIRGEERLVTDGPFMETKEHLLGFYLIDVPDLYSALDWAARMPVSKLGTIEVRPVATGQPWQAVLDSA